MTKTHLYFRNPEEGLVEYKSRPGGGGKKEDEEDEEEKDYTFMAEIFAESQEIFKIDLIDRKNNRNLKIPVHFDLIEIEFFGAFDQPKFESYYFDTFGLELMHLSVFNRKGLFAIEDSVKFNYFFKQITLFVEKVLTETDKKFDSKILFIKNFKLFSSDDMYGSIDNYENVHLSFLGKGFIEERLIKQQKKEFIEFLDLTKIEYDYSDQSAELFNISEDVLKELLDNFDFIYASCSGSGAVIQPDVYNTPIRDFGFDISNHDASLPIIGIIDTGISNKTPLGPILIGENGDYDTTNTGSFVDNADHGTGVAAFAAIGNKLIPGYRGSIEADAKLLSMKILDSKSGSISQKKVTELIRKANIEYNVRIFCLTIGYSDFPLNNNQEFSSYAQMLDELTAELDILIFISTTNNIFNIESQEDYPSKFEEERANIAPPAESMNNITIGAIANNFSDNNLRILSTTKEFPSLYSRKLHYDFDNKEIFNAQTGNSYIRKPDVLLAGGDYTEYVFLGDTGYDYGGDAGLEVLSSNLGIRTFFGIGTSYSTPIAANMAAKLIKTYPNLDMQSIKALMINGSDEIKTGEIFNNFTRNLKNRVFGYGTPEFDSIIYSDDKKVTMIIEDEIYPNYIRMFPLQLPKYLNNAKRKNSLLKINATLCFKFSPKLDNQLLYCPFHVSYAIGKNLDLNTFHKEVRTDDNGRSREINVPDGYNGNSATKIKINSSSKGWAQDYYYKGKIVSNVQKISFNVAKQNIVDEKNCFKIAVNADFHKLLTDAEKEPYNTSIPYSIVISIEQMPLKNEILPSLYDELILINDLDAVAETELEVEV